MSALSDRLREAYPAFADVSTFSDVLLEDAITDAQNELESDTWAHLYDRACLALAAHTSELGARAALGGAGLAGAGTASQFKTGDEAITFVAVGAATATASEVSLRTTPYGLEFLRLQGQVIRPFFVVI